MIRMFLFFLFLICGCSPRSSYNISEKEKLTNKVLSHTSQEISKKYELRPLGSGGQMMDEIKMLYLAFECQKPLSIDEARSLILKCVKMFNFYINENEQIRPYLVNYPFSQKNLEMAIFIQDSRGKDIGDLIIVSYTDGKIKYKVSNPETIGKTILIETIEQAEKNLIEQSS